MSNPNSYHQGGNVRLVGTFVNPGGTLIDPAAVTLVLSFPVQAHSVRPGTVQYTYASGSITRQAAGSFTFDLTPIPSGTYGVWTHEWVGSAPNIVYVGQVNIYQRP